MIPGVGVMFHPDRPIGETVDLRRRGRAAGLRGRLGIGLASVFRDMFAALTLVAERTSRISIGTASRSRCRDRPP